MWVKGKQGLLARGIFNGESLLRLGRRRAWCVCVCARARERFYSLILRLTHCGSLELGGVSKE